jgi:tetratricopeptide (TPR) repeat protein
LNTGPEARHVGIAACAECHPKKHQSYVLTPHSRALSDLRPGLEPPDGSFLHEASGRTYRVYRRDGQLRHEEVLRTPDGQEMGRVDLPIRYRIGSGHFARTYLLEIDGFLHESPITWYATKKKWDVSPGYDASRHWGFERSVDAECLACHAGRVEAAAGTTHQMIFHEKAIGCEKCHGPGSLHVELHRSKLHVAGTEDLTIVNPARLSRPLLESTCAACHLNAAVTIPVRGRQVTDYRPGMPLTDYRIDYRFDVGDEQMTVVGHIEQLRLSACYQKSQMTCLTCHDPHANTKPKDPVAFYRRKCLDCHREQGCKLVRAKRLKKEPTDNCAACHMPRGNTDIPHVAFTHHRIGLHAKQESTASEAIPNLVPTDDISHLPPLDQKRNLGLAYLKLTRTGRYSNHVEVFSERARELLEAVRAAGLRDAQTAHALADIYLYKKKDPLAAVILAREALESSDASVDVRAASLSLLATAEIQEGDFASAGQQLEELVRTRRYAHDWRRLGVCYLEQNQRAKALLALEKALEMRPLRPIIHANLAQAYEQRGDARRAAEHFNKAQWLMRNNQE